MQHDRSIQPPEKYLRYEDKARRIAMRRAYEKSDEFKDRHRWRRPCLSMTEKQELKTELVGLIETGA